MAERTEKQRLAGTNQQTATELAEAKRQLAALTRQINSAGMQPVPLPEKAQVTPEQINFIRENFPEMAVVLDTVVQKIDYLQQGQPAQAANQPSGNPVADAMNAVPDLKSWQDQDPDRFTLAVHIDTNLQNDPAWKDKSLTERFAEVAKRTKAAYGESVEPVQQQSVQQQQATTITATAATQTTADVQRIAAEKLAAATAATQVTIDRAMLLGGQGLANAYGTGDGGGFFGYNEEKVDHGNGTEVSIRWINGLKKIRFKQKDGRVNDHGVMVVDSAVTLGK